MGVISAISWQSDKAVDVSVSAFLVLMQWRDAPVCVSCLCTTAWPVFHSTFSTQGMSSQLGMPDIQAQQEAVQAALSAGCSFE